ncbi:MAG: hypothetical protein V2I33_12545 [Kangiellaceae bacterium]|jgi:hypothetical protein|nr:hypothetical protein [Kangiellaceae bacterium]
MEFFKWIAVIVIVVTIGEVWKYQIKMKHRGEKSEKQNDQNDSRLAELEQRVTTLEKIVTDPSESLKREINDL